MHYAFQSGGSLLQVPQDPRPSRHLPCSLAQIRGMPLQTQRINIKYCPDQLLGRANLKHCLWKYDSMPSRSRCPRSDSSTPRTSPSSFKLLLAQPLLILKPRKMLSVCMFSAELVAFVRRRFREACTENVQMVQNLATKKNQEGQTDLFLILG